MKNFINSFLADTSGAAAAEYALILAVVGSIAAAALTGLGGAISTAITNTTAKIAPAAAATPTNP